MLRMCKAVGYFAIPRVAKGVKNRCLLKFLALWLDRLTPLEQVQRSLAGWHMVLIPALGVLRQVDLWESEARLVCLQNEFRDSQGYTVCRYTLSQGRKKEKKPKTEKDPQSENAQHGNPSCLAISSKENNYSSVCGVLPKAVCPS